MLQVAGGSLPARAVPAERRAWDSAPTRARPTPTLAAALPFLVAAIAALTFIPQDNLAESIIAYTLALGSGTAAAACFIGGFVVKGLQDD